MNESSGRQWVEKSDNIYLRFVLEIGPEIIGSSKT